jgi:hypothetical protein
LLCKQEVAGSIPAGSMRELAANRILQWPTARAADLAPKAGNDCGQRCAYSSDQGYQQTIWAMNADGTGQTRRQAARPPGLERPSVIDHHMVAAAADAGRGAKPQT